MTKKEVIKRIKAIALKSSSFKIGETGMDLQRRLQLYPDFSRIEGITWSKDRDAIDKLEKEMNAYFFKFKNNANKKKGSAGEMAEDSDKYMLYVVYRLRRT